MLEILLKFKVLRAEIKQAACVSLPLEGRD
jgi:hypothetical protein